MMLLAAVLAAAGAAAPVVALDSGRIVGTQASDGLLAFRSIPYAAPPIGPLRWRAPAPVRRWRGVRAATTSSPSCPQLDDGWNHANAINSAEDCLYLEVGTPTVRPPHPLPVLVWIHGGSNVAGGAAGTIRSSIVKRGIVLVSVQYRLGPLGFLAHPALTHESRTHASGNYGLMDQQAALRWVQRNIARFGGDPARVTIAGESAGAQDVGLQQLSPLAKGLFAQAIEGSGSAAFGFPPRDLKTSEAIGVEILAQAGAPRANARTMRSLPVDALLKAARRIATPPGLPDVGTVWLQTTIDGHVITEPPARTLMRGGGQRVPLLIGSNTREIGFYPTRNAAQRAIAAGFGADTRQALRFYGLDQPSAPPSSPIFGPAELRVATDLVFTCPTAFVAGARAAAGVPVYRYRFGYAAPGADVTHGSELRLIFGNPGEDGLPVNAPPLQAYWAEFIRSGNPNTADLPRWPIQTAGTAPYLDVASTEITAQSDGDDSICALRPYP
jgi:para-nitrobenzyl esterase